MSFSWLNTLRASMLRPANMNKSINEFDETSQLPIYTKILNYEQRLKKLILNVNSSFLTIQ